MSIFGDFLSPMSDIFIIRKGGYRYKDSIRRAPVTCSQMRGWNFRDPGTIPLARGTSLPRELISDFVLDEDKFDCLVDGKRQWVKWSDVFDEPVNEVADIFEKFALDGEFDNSLPMYENDSDEELDEEQDEDAKVSIKRIKNPYGYHSWEYQWTTKIPVHDTSIYWNIVSSAVIENIRKHIRPNVEVYLSGGVVSSSTYDFTKKLGFQIRIISIDGKKCHWLNNMHAAMDIMHNTHKTQFTEPSIDFMYAIDKKGSENVDVNLYLDRS